MTRKDYVLLAGALSDAMDASSSDAERFGLKNAAEYIASALSDDNPRFDRERFLVAAGVVQS